MERLKEWIQYLAVSAVVAMALMMAYREIIGEIDNRGIVLAGVAGGLFAKWCDSRNERVAR